MRSILFGLSLSAFAFTAIAGGVESPSAEQFAKEFYRTLLAQKPLGVPNPSQWRTLRPYFTKDLAVAIGKAQKTEAEHSRKHADEPPVFGDGCLFTSLYEGPRRFHIGKIRPGSDYQRVGVELIYVSGNEKTSWTDTLILIPKGKTWQIRDIEFGGKWQFKTGNSLRGVFSLR